MNTLTTIPLAEISRLKIGDTATCDLDVTEQHVAAFAELSGDINPLHMETAIAQAAGFPRRVAHGMLALSAISRLIGTQLPGGGSLWTAQEVRFGAPVFVGDSVTARVTIEQISTGAQMIKLRTDVVNKSTGAVVLSGTAMVRIPPRTNQETNRA